MVASLRDPELHPWQRAILRLLYHRSGWISRDELLAAMPDNYGHITGRGTGLAAPLSGLARRRGINGKLIERNRDQWRLTPLGREAVGQIVASLTPEIRPRDILWGRG